MVGKHRLMLAALVLLVTFLLPGVAQAGPYLGEWGWCWHPEKDCPRGKYCFLHYWTPQFYRVSYCVHHPNVDQYPPGLPIPAGSQLYPFPCRTVSPTPTPPYADPAGYYGRPIIPPPEEGNAANKDAKANEAVYENR
jgi:hypothetical protein